MTIKKTNNPRFSMSFRKSSIAERFHMSYKVAENGCWEWIGSFASRRSLHRYGIIRENKKTLLAHRVSWQLLNGCIPDGLFVCHKCDNPPCVNPDHLFLGTSIDNTVDRESKGRGPQGERNWCAKLKEEDIPVIKQMYEDGKSQWEIALNFGVHQGTISQVVNNVTWQHILKSGE